MIQKVHILVRNTSINDGSGAIIIMYSMVCVPGHHSAYTKPLS